jgi:hypothetical protein
MQQDLISLTETAKRLRVKPDYVHQLVVKGRLHLIEHAQFDAEEVEKLALLIEKLRTNGISTLVSIVEDGKQLPL